MEFKVYLKAKQVIGAPRLLPFSVEEVGLFESLRTYEQKFFRASEHFARFQESAKTMGLRNVKSSALLEKELAQTLAAYEADFPNTKKEDKFIRLTYVKGRYYYFVGSRRHSKQLYKKGVRLQTVSVLRSLPEAFSPQVKTNAYQNSLLAELDLQREQAYQSVMLDRDGFVTESSIGNIFMVREGELWTPPRWGILNGVTRRVVIECALQEGIPFQEKPISRHEIFNADEAFLTNTSWEILPVSDLDRRRIGKQIPGRVTQKLMKAFKTLVKKECL